MAVSMTGFGRAKEILNGREIAVEIKSVNARYFEYNSRLPRALSFLDDALKKTVSSVAGRGKIELHLSIQALEAAESEVVPNLPLACGYYEAMAAIARHLRIDNDIKVSHMARFSDLFTLRRADADEDALQQDVLAVAGAAVQRWGQMRALEGEKLTADIAGRLDGIEAMLGQVEAESAGRVQRYTARLQERLKELLEDRNIEESRLLTEAAIFADKTAVDEETVRLRSHIRQFREILGGAGAQGRKLDFLTQELNREINTIGSKCQELDITRLVVEMKAEAEKIREQIQNLE